MITLELFYLLRKKVKFLIFLFVLSLKVNGQTLDQQQMIYNGGMSARNLASYSEWQSFTAGMTGNLCQIKMGFFNAINGSGTFKVFSGSGTAGPLLQSQTVSINVTGGNYMVTFNVSVSITSGSVYTFQFIPGAGIPDPYGVQVQVPGTYSGGQMGLVDPSGTYFPGFDLVFQTYVCSLLPIELIDFNAKLNDKHQTEITWTTASQLNNDFFTVEKSNDALSFETLDVVDGAGTIDAPMSYSTIDEHPFIGTTYYRLKQTDFDGISSYSNVISIKIEHDEMNVSWFFSSPEDAIHFFIQCADENFVTIELFDVSGKIIFQLQAATNSNGRIALNGFPKGIYFLKVSNAKVVVVKKMMIN